MMKKCLFLLVVIAFFSCSQDGKVTMVLENQSVASKVAPLDSMDVFYSRCVFKNTEERLRFTNALRFRITNNTNKKQLFFVKDLRLVDIPCLVPQIFDSEGKPVGIPMPIGDPYYEDKEELKKLIAIMGYDFEKSYEEGKLLRRMNFKRSLVSNSYYNQYVIIPSGESYVYITTLALPFLIDDSLLNLRDPAYSRLDPRKKYEISLQYRLTEDVEKLLPKDLLLNFKENNVEIFKDSLETQRIPIVFEE